MKFLHAWGVLGDDAIMMSREEEISKSEYLAEIARIQAEVERLRRDLERLAKLVAGSNPSIATRNTLPMMPQSAPPMPEAQADEELVKQKPLEPTTPQPLDSWGVNDSVPLSTRQEALTLDRIPVSNVSKSDRPSSVPPQSTIVSTSDRPAKEPTPSDSPSRSNRVSDIVSRRKDTPGADGGRYVFVQERASTKKR